MHHFTDAPVARMAENANFCNRMTQNAITLNCMQQYIRYELMFELHMADIDMASRQMEFINLQKQDRK